MTEQPRRTGRRMGGGPAVTVSTVDDATEPELPARRPAEAAATGGPVSAPDGTFTASDNPAAADLVPAGGQPAQPPAAPPAPPPAGGPVFGLAAAGWDRTDQGGQEVPRAVDLCGPRPRVRREQISAHVPEDLKLKRRLTLYALDHGADMQDVVAVALDQWLRPQNY